MIDTDHSPHNVLTVYILYYICKYNDKAYIVISHNVMYDNIEACEVHCV